MLSLGSFYFSTLSPILSLFILQTHLPTYQQILLIFPSNFTHKPPLKTEYCPGLTFMGQSLKFHMSIHYKIKFIRETMRRIDHIGMKDILRKRQVKTANHSQHINQNQQPTLLSSHKDITLESIVEKILKSDVKVNHLVDLTMEEKFTIVQFMSEREKISYNRTTLGMLMKVWRCPGTCWVHNDNNNEVDYSLSIVNRPIRNFFLLSGSVAIFENNMPKNVFPEKQGDTEQITFQTQSKPEQLITPPDGAEPKQVIEEYSGWGPMFRKQPEDANLLIKITNAIVIQIQPPEFQGALINLGGMDQEKKIKIIEHFPIFSNTSKKMQSILPYISLKRYNKNQYIYKIKQIPEAIYLILRGEIVFEAKVQLPKQKKQSLNKSLSNQFFFQTEALGIGNYFGEEEVIFKTNRTLNTICNSAECDLLEIPLEKFQKLLAYTDFYEEIKSASEVKIKKRKQKIEKALAIHQQFSKHTQSSVEEPQKEQRKSSTIDIKKQTTKKKTTEPVRLMHGNIIRKVPMSNNNEQVSFSMLGANPDLYQATLKKFRKYTMKPAEKYKPQVNWNLKRVWKVLNLESILREEGEITSPEGRKFYQSHRRLQNHVQQVKSLRPKTSSSTYRTKLQYIAYLQQFNG